MFSDGATALTTFQYDAFGNVTRAEDRNGQVKVYAYDELLRLRTELWYDEQGQLANTVTRTYDAANRLVNLADSFSNYAYLYDSLDRVVQETIANPGAPTVVLNTGYGDVGQGYRLDGLRTSSSVEIAGTADYVATLAYNALNQLTEISQAGQGGSAVAGKHVSLTYTDTGLIDTVTRYASTDASNLVVPANYTYDAQGRLTALSYYQDPADPLNEYTWAYDAAGRLIRQTSSDGSADYAYDAAGQVTAADYDYQADESYQYDENGNRVSADGAAYQTDDHNRMTSDGAYAYSYDDEGNRTARFLDNDLSGDLSDGDTDITQYAWDVANRLASVAFRDTYDGPAAKTLTYTYDAYSRLIRKTVDPDGQQGTADLLQTAYVYDGDQIVLQFDRTGGGDVQASDLSHRYLWGPAVDQILADETVGDGGSDNVLWPLVDHQGTVRDLAFYDEADAETSIANHVAYNAFGRKTSETNAAVDCVFAYTGRLLDDDTGLQNHLHRWYDPETAKWLSEDPIGFEAGDANLTRWVGNAGTTGVDPDGLQVPNLLLGGGVELTSEGTVNYNALAPNSVNTNLDIRWEIYRYNTWGELPGDMTRRTNAAVNATVAKTLKASREAANAAGEGFGQGCVNLAQGAQNLFIETTNALAWAQNGVIETVNIILFEIPGYSFRIPQHNYIRKQDWSHRLVWKDEPEFLHDSNVLFSEMTIAAALPGGKPEMARAAKPAPSKSGIVFDRYGALRDSTIPGQAHHLNQNAVYGGVIPKNEGISTKLLGDAFNQPGTPHYVAHDIMEGFWDTYRRASGPRPQGMLFGEMPTNSQYNRALYNSLQKAGWTPTEALQAVRQAKAQQLEYGLRGWQDVPNFPNPINQQGGRPRW